MPVSSATRPRTRSALAASRTADVAKGSSASTPLSSETSSASLTVAVIRSMPSSLIDPSASRSSASLSVALCE